MSQMNETNVKELLDLIQEKVKNLDNNLCAADKRLTITLRYLEKGESFVTLGTQCGIAENETKISLIIVETCAAITKALSSYLKTPKTSSEWKVSYNLYKALQNVKICIDYFTGCG